MNYSAQLTIPDMGDSGIDGLFSSSELEKIYDASTFHIERLLSRQKELIAQSRSQFTPVYALDFQELYSYMYPFTNQSIDAIIINYLLDNSIVPFILLGGTAYELKVHLTKLAGELNILPKEVFQNSGEYPHHVSLRIDKFIDQIKFRNLPKNSNIENGPPLSRLLGTLAIHTNAINRLSSLLSSNKFIKFSDLYPEQEELGIDEKIYDISKKILNIVRPSRTESNMADAINISSVAWMRNHPSPSNTKCYLITHTPTLLRQGTWMHTDKNKGFEVDPEIFKSSLDSFYSTVITKHSYDIQGQIKFVSSALGKCTALRNRVLSMPNFISIKGGDFSKKLEDIWKLTESKALEGDLQNFKDFFRDPFTRTVDKYLVENARHNLNIMEIYHEGATRAIKSELEVFESMVKLRGYIDLILDMAGNKAGYASKEILEIDSKAKHNLALNVFSIKEKRETNPVTGTIKYSINSNDGQMIITLEKFIEGFFSIYWHTLIPLDKFAEQINKFIDNLQLRHNTLKRGIINYKMSREDDIDLQGVILKTSKNEYIFPLKLPFQVGPLFNELKKDEIVYFIRVNTLAGDFYIEVFDPSLQKPHIMGYMANKKLIPEILQLFDETSRNFYWNNLLHLQIKNELRNFKVS